MTQSQATKTLDPIRTGSSVRALAYSPHGHFLATAGIDRSLTLWRGTEQVWSVRFGSWFERLFANADIRAMAFSADGNSLFVLVGDTVRRLDVESGRETWRKRTGTTLGFLRIRPLAISAGPGGNLAIALDDARVELREPDQGRVVARWQDNDGPNLLHFLPDGRLIGTDHQSVCIWDALTGMKLARHIPSDRLHAMAVSPDGSKLALRTLHSVEVWTIEGEMMGDFTVAPGLPTLAYSPHGEAIAAGDARGVTLWNLDGSVKARWDADTPTLALTFAPNGDLAVAGADGAVRCWRTAGH